MLIKYSDWKRPIDGDYAFALRPVAPALPSVGSRTDIRQVVREVLAEDAERFEQRIRRWSGPEDVVGGAQPYASEQLFFEERGTLARLGPRDVEAVLEGRVQVLRGPVGQVDYLLRDHHMLDVALYHHRTTGELPRALFHADRHSDWCKDSYLEARVPQQAATWWKLLEGLKRPLDGKSVLGEGEVFFATGRAPSRKGRDVAGSVTVPSALEGVDLGWEATLSREGASGCDWVSVDLDFFQPAPQLRLARGLVRDPRFSAMLRAAKVRVFVLSPQFTLGGDKVEPWVIQGSRHSSLRLLNLFRSRS